MKNNTLKTAVVAAVALSLFSNCKPRSYRTELEPQAITCPSAAEVYAYRGVPVDSATACTFGKINTATGGSTSIASLTASIYFNQGAYHITENNYYAFKAQDTTRTLFKISMAGVVTPLTNSSYGSTFDGLVYNRFNGKLYCFRLSGGTSHIAEIVVSGSTYTTVDLATTLLPEQYDNATVNPLTGDIYYQTRTSAGSNVEKYHPGGSVSTVCSAMPIELWGMRYNPNDNNLYAVIANSSSATGFEFVKISSSGTLTVLSAVPFINFKKFSACFDPCTDHYIFSYPGHTAPIQGHLMQLNTSGTVLQHDSAATLYQGMAVKY